MPWERDRPQARPRGVHLSQKRLMRLRGSELTRGFHPKWVPGGGSSSIWLNRRRCPSLILDPQSCDSFRNPLYWSESVRLPRIAGPYPDISYRSAVVPEDFDGDPAPETHYKEWFSWAVVASTAAAAGLIVHVPAVDDTKSDVRVETFRAWEGKYRHMALQVKATANPTFIGPPEATKLSYSLDAGTYNALVQDSSIQRFLVVVAVPPQDQCWVRLRSSIVVMNAGAWWCEVTGEETDQGSKTVHLPVEQRFDLAGLETMLRIA